MSDILDIISINIKFTISDLILTLKLNFHFAFQNYTQDTS